jgi:hypothetical protein
MKNKSKLKEIIGKANSLSAGEIMAAVNRGDTKIDGAEVLEKPYQSQAQARYIHAKAGEGEKWAKKFVAHSEGQPVGELPEKVEKGLKSKIATGIAGATMMLGGTAQASNPSPNANGCAIGHKHVSGSASPSGASWSNTGNEAKCHTHKDGGHLKPISNTVKPDNHVFDKDAHSRKNITMTKATPPPPDAPNPNDPYYQMGRNLARPAAKKVPEVSGKPSGIKQGWLDHAYKGVSRPMETIKKADPEIGHTEPVAPKTKERWAKDAAGGKSNLNPIGQGKEGVYRPGHHEWNAFVDHLTSTPETAESGVHDARWFAANAIRGNAHHNAARDIIGDEHFPEVYGALHEAAQGLAESKKNATDPTPFVTSMSNIRTKMAHPDKMTEAIDHINRSVDAHTKATNHMNSVGIPEQHHDAIFSSAATWEPTVKKSLVKSVLGKLKKAMPTPKEDKQEAGEASPSLDRVTEAPAEGDTRPFMDTKATFKQLKERHAIFKKKIQQDREDGSADDTAIYSMNEADVTKPLEKSSAPSYKTLRTAKLPDGKKVNVYGNNGYERISNGPHRGRYLHSVMAEHKLGRKLKGNEEIDHKNGDRKGNGLSNLRLTTTSQHAAHTNTERAKQGGFTGEKRYMHSREYTEGKPESMEKGLSDYKNNELKMARELHHSGVNKQSPQYKSAVRGIVQHMKARTGQGALASHEPATDFTQAQREGAVHHLYARVKQAQPESMEKGLRDSINNFVAPSANSKPGLVTDIRRTLTNPHTVNNSPGAVVATAGMALGALGSGAAHEWEKAKADMYSDKAHSQQMSNDSFQRDAEIQKLRDAKTQRKASMKKGLSDYTTGDLAQAQREGKIEDPKGTGAPAWQKPAPKPITAPALVKPMNKAEGFNPDNMFAPEAPKTNIKNVIAKLQAKNNNEKMFANTVNELQNPPPTPAPQSDKPDLANFTAKYRMRKSKK